MAHLVVLEGETGGLSMTDFPTFKFSKGEVKRAGEALRGNLAWPEQDTSPEADSIRHVFHVANNWVDCHQYPMHRIRHELMGHIGAQRLNGVTAARLKRISSIRKKLRLIDGDLQDFQDLGGCRVIVGSMSDLNHLIETYRDRAKHKFVRPTDYIARPKHTGYRCHHLIYRFLGEGEQAVHSTRLIEIQFRTRIQHSWATAVEAIGLIRNEDLKGNSGNKEWLRLFLLMSAELALAENCPEGEHVPPRHERLREIKELAKQVNAVSMLDNARATVLYNDTHIKDPNLKPQFYLVEYDNQARSVSVKPYTQPIAGAVAYHQADNNDGHVRNAVLVEVDSVEALIEAYPNFYGDVDLFQVNLKRIVGGKDALDYDLARQEVVRTQRPTILDPFWLRRSRWGRWGRRP